MYQNIQVDSKRYFFMIRRSNKQESNIYVPNIYVPNKET